MRNANIDFKVNTDFNDLKYGTWTWTRA